jgi:hypothetical protein
VAAKQSLRFTKRHFWRGRRIGSVQYLIELHSESSPYLKGSMVSKLKRFFDSHAKVNDVGTSEMSTDLY